MWKSFCSAALAAVAGAVCLAAAAPAQSVIELEAAGPGGALVAGDLVLPDGHQGPVPAVMLLSGSGPQDRMAEMLEGAYSAHRDWTRQLTAAGFAVIRYDEPGTGGSGGDWAETGIYELKDAALSVLDAAAATGRLDSERLYILGHSEGAMIAMIMAAERADLAGLVLAAGPGGRLLDILEHQTRVQVEAFSSDPEAQAQKRAELDATMGAAIMHYASLRESAQLDPLGMARLVEAPVLVIHGANDIQIPCDQAVSLAGAISSTGVPATLEIVPDVNHLLVFDPEMTPDYETLETLTLDPRVSARVTGWLSERAGLDE